MSPRKATREAVRLTPAMYGTPTAVRPCLPLLLAQSSVQVALNGVQEVRGVQEMFIQLHTAKRTMGATQAS